MPFIVQSDGFFNHALGTSAGSLSPRTKWKDLIAYEVALLPKDEQQRVAEILWAANKSVEQAAATIDVTQATITAIRSKKFGQLENADVRLIALCEPKGIHIGPFGSQLHASDYVNEGIPVIMPSDMSDDHVCEESIAQITSEMADDLSNHKVLPGDILLPRRGELDRRVFIRPEQAGWICGTGSIRIRVQNSIPSRAVFHALAAPQTVTWLKSNAVGTTMPNLNAKIVSNIPVALPERQELHNILQILESLNNALSLAIRKHKSLKHLKQALMSVLL